MSILLLNACSDEQEKKLCSADMSGFRTDEMFEGKFHRYKLERKENYNIPGRKRVRLVITAPTALTKMDRAATAVSVALIYYGNNPDTPAIQVWLDNATGDARLGYVDLFVDGCGDSGTMQTPVWTVQASDAAPETRSLDVILRNVDYRNERINPTGV
jgi:hypothetical protein